MVNNHQQSASNQPLTAVTRNWESVFLAKVWFCTFKICKLAEVNENQIPTASSHGTLTASLPQNSGRKAKR